MNQKSVVANPSEYPQPVNGYYAQAFKKTKEERKELKKVVKLHKKLIKEEYGKENSPKQLKKIMNPSNIRLKD